MEIHSFRVDIATKYGIAEAILLGYFYHWITVHEKNDTNFYDGRYWTYDSERTLTEKMPYIPKSTMHRLIKKLVDSGLLLTGNYNKFSYDKTKWFSLSDIALALLEKNTCPKMDHHLPQNGATIPIYNEETKIDLPPNGPPLPQNGATIPIQSTYSLEREKDNKRPAPENFPGSKYSKDIYDKAMSTYERFIGPVANMGTKESILSCVDDYGLNNFIDAVKVAARNNARSFSYIETVLQNNAAGGDCSGNNRARTKKNKNANREEKRLTNKNQLGTYL